MNLDISMLEINKNEFKKVFPHVGSEALFHKSLSDCHTCWSLLWAYMLATKLKRGLPVQNATSNFWCRMINRDVLDLEIYLQVSETQRVWHGLTGNFDNHHLIIPCAGKSKKILDRLLSDIDILLVRCGV